MHSPENNLAITIDLAASLRLMELGERGGPEETDLDWLSRSGVAARLASQADELLYRGKEKGKAARLFNDLARALAIMAYFPGGVRFNGVLYKVSKEAAGADH